MIWYNGKAYRYNHDLVTMLVMGIDQESDTIEEKDDVSGESGQADTIFLMVMDKSKDEIKMISISRDTMTQIKTFDYKGNYLGKSKNHLGLAYSFGDGKVTSCQYMVDAVSNLFYGMPINGYVALNMNAVGMINDAVGGVTVTVPEDMTQVDPSFAEGGGDADRRSGVEVYTLSRYGKGFFQQFPYGASETVPCEFYGTGGEGDEIGYGTSGQPLSESYG